MTLILEVRFKSSEGKDIFQEYTVSNKDSYSIAEVTLKKVEEKTIILDIAKGQNQ